jgi:hypothetical protein
MASDLALGPSNADANALANAADRGVDSTLVTARASPFSRPMSQPPSFGNGRYTVTGPVTKPPLIICADP